MAQVNLPMTLSAASWDKQKSALAKLAKPPATKLPDELKELTKLHLGVDWDAFGADKLKTAAEVQTRSDELDAAVKGKIKSLLAKAESVEKSASTFETDAKKDKAFPKEPLAAATAIVKAAKEYRADVDAAVDAARKALETKAKAMPKAGAGGGTGAGASGGPSSAAVVKQTKLAKSRLLTALSSLRKPTPNARPMRFMIVLGKSSASLALAYAVGPAQEKLLKGLMPGEAPYKIMKDLKAEVVWEKNALTFVSDRVSSTLLKKVQLWLKKLLKLNLKMRIRKSSGEVEETEGDDIPDSMLQVDPADAPDGMTQSEVADRMKGLQADLKEGEKGPSAARLKALVDSYNKLLKAGKFDDADGALDDIEALLAEGKGDDEDGQDEGEGEEPKAQPKTGQSPTGTSTPKQDDNGKSSYDKRLAGMQSALKTGLAGATGARVKELVEGMNKLTKAEKFADAEKVLDGIQKLLGGGGATGGGATTPATGGGKESADKAMEEWKTRRAAAVNSLKAVATKVAGAKHASSTKAIIELQAVIKNLTAEPSTLKQVNELQQWLTNDDVVNDVCEMDQDIRTPLLGALGKLREALAA